MKTRPPVPRTLTTEVLPHINHFLQTVVPGGPEARSASATGPCCSPTCSS
jgi:hypothetical protein